MSNSWLLTNLLAAFLLPPLNLLLIGATGYWLLGAEAQPGESLDRHRPWRFVAAVHATDFRHIAGQPETRPGRA
jgi:hypothetical protein